MKSTVTLIRIDPTKRTIARLSKPFQRNMTRDIRQVLRAGHNEGIGMHELATIEEKRLTKKVPHPKLAGMTHDVDVGGTPLLAFGLLNVDPAAPMWRLLGAEDHAGVGALFGKGDAGGVIDVPVDVAWVEQRIVWLDGEDLDALQVRADAMVDMLPDEVREALMRAVPGKYHAGAPSTWLLAEDNDLYPAMIRLGLADGRTKGQRLTRLGGAVRELIGAIHDQPC